jgi:hypothetical protein
LGAEDTLFGTRILALGDKLDVVVPSDRARYPGKINLTVDGHPGFDEFTRHSSIVNNPEAMAVAHAFLRDAPPPCPDGSDAWRAMFGRVIGSLEKKLDGALRLGEDLVIARVGAGEGGSLLKGGAGALREAFRMWRVGGAQGLRALGRERLGSIVAWGRGQLSLLRDPRLLVRRMEGVLADRARTAARTSFVRAIARLVLRDSGHAER